MMHLAKNLSGKWLSVRSGALALIFGVFLIAPLDAQVLTSIDAHITGMKSRVIKLGFYFGDKTYVIDSTRLDSTTGNCRFVGKNMRQGVYFLSTGKTKIFDFVMEKPGTPLRFTMDISKPGGFPDPGDSPENQAFMSFQRFRRQNEISMRRLNYSRDLIAKATHNNPDALVDIERQGKACIDSLEDFVTSYIAQYPDFLFSKMLRAAQSPKPPADLPPVLDGKPNPAYQRWMAARYWRQYDFNDDRLLYSEFFVTNLKVYVSRFSSQHPDSVAGNIDRLMALMPKDSQFYRFTVLYLTQQFEAVADNPGLDRLFVHMIDQYQKVGQTPWLDKATLLRLEEKANYHRNNLTGSIAPEFNLSDEKGNTVSLHHVKANYTLLIFYSALCPHCMETMPGLAELYNQYEPKGLKAVAVNTDDQFEHWKAFLPDQHWTWINLADPTGKNVFQADYGAWNLPVIYLLDKNKMILYKRIKMDKLGQVLQSLLDHG